VSLAPDDADGYYWRGYVKLRIGEAEAAHADFQKVLRLTTDRQLREQVQDLLQPA
jgi:predicted TPR repeat methyltransferase